MALFLTKSFIREIDVVHNLKHWIFFNKYEMLFYNNYIVASEKIKKLKWSFDSSRLKLLLNYICFYSALYVVDIISSVSKELTPTCRASEIPLASFQDDEVSGTCKICQMAESIFIARTEHILSSNQDQQFFLYSSNFVSVCPFPSFTHDIHDLLPRLNIENL